MIKKLILAIPLVLICCLLMSAKAFALSDSDMAINIASPIDSLASESGVVAVEQFPARIAINTPRPRPAASQRSGWSTAAKAKQ
jgi:hypothetical protein